MDRANLQELRSALAELDALPQPSRLYTEAVERGIGLKEAQAQRLQKIGTAIGQLYGRRTYEEILAATQMTPNADVVAAADLLLDAATYRRLKWPLSASTPRVAPDSNAVDAALETVMAVDAQVEAAFESSIDYLSTEHLARYFDHFLADFGESDPGRMRAHEGWKRAMESVHSVLQELERESPPVRLSDGDMEILSDAVAASIADKIRSLARHTMAEVPSKLRASNSVKENLASARTKWHLNNATTNGLARFQAIVAPLAIAGKAIVVVAPKWAFTTESEDSHGQRRADNLKESLRSYGLNKPVDDLADDRADQRTQLEARVHAAALPVLRAVRDEPALVELDLDLSINHALRNADVLADQIRTAKQVLAVLDLLERNGRVRVAGQRSLKKTVTGAAVLIQAQLATEGEIDPEFTDGLTQLSGPMVDSLNDVGAAVGWELRWVGSPLPSCSPTSSTFPSRARLSISWPPSQKRRPDRITSTRATRCNAPSGAQPIVLIGKYRCETKNHLMIANDVGTMDSEAETAGGASWSKNRGESNASTKRRHHHQRHRRGGIPAQ